MRITVFSAALLAGSLVFAATPIDGGYTSVFGGYTWLPGNISNNNFGLFRNSDSYRGGYNVGARVGYQSNPIRYEGEYTWLSTGANSFKINNVAQTGVSGYSSANLVMANLYYDFREFVPAISPFVGAGIGYAYIRTSLNSTGPNSGITFFRVSDNAFAYQVTAGLTYNFAENYALNIAYRYVASSTGSNFGKYFQAQIASAGVVYHFDQGNYK